ncbi:SDR family oxidoreductase [Chromobacterium haemolyticum]|nr:SDR family oxidoreductase [Chromobacterium haemolyticum]
MGAGAGPLNICVTAIAPGICKTKMLGQFVDRQMVEHSDETIVKSIVPVGRWGLPEDIAEVVTFLATCKTNYLNATVIPLDGGMRVGTL